MSMENLVSTLVDFDLHTGLSQARKPLQRYLTNMKGLFCDEAAYAAALGAGNPLVYEFFDMGVPDSEKEIAYGTIGDESLGAIEDKIISFFLSTQGHGQDIRTNLWFCHGHTTQLSAGGQIR